ncbi:MAG: cytochrome c [Woeseiaceae bacterium]|nr:cytochrome c [Woeseiaceae bacterium]
MSGVKIPALLIGLVLYSIAIASDDAPQQVRQDLMKDVRQAAKPVGNMLREKEAFNAETMMSSLMVFAKVADQYGAQFPEGSESGFETEAAPAIWEDREGFDMALMEFAEATKIAIESGPQTLEDARTTVSPIFKTCKGCHDNYRIED